MKCLATLLDISRDVTSTLEIDQLLEHFLEQIGSSFNKKGCSLSAQSKALLARHSWPGNIRELENAIERGVILMRGEYLDIESLPMAVQNWAGMNPKKEEEQPSTLREAERVLILKTLEETDGNRSEAARRLQITRKTLLNKLKRYGV